MTEDLEDSAWEAACASVRSAVGEEKWSEGFDPLRAARWRRTAAFVARARRALPLGCTVGVLRAGDGLLGAALSSEGCSVVLLDSEYFRDGANSLAHLDAFASGTALKARRFSARKKSDLGSLEDALGGGARARGVKMLEFDEDLSW